jgi:hypothetical protein
MRKRIFVLIGVMLLVGVAYAGQTLNQGQIDQKIGVYGTSNGTDFESLQGAADTVTITQTTSTVGGYQYDLTIPAGTKAIKYQVRTAAESRVAFLDGDVSESITVDATGPFYTVKSGTVYTVDGLDIASNLTLYASVTPSGSGTIIELQTWK